MKLNFLRAESALAALVGLGVFVQVYLVAGHIYGAGGLDAHRHVGNTLLVLIFLTAANGFIARWGDWRGLLPSIGLLVVGVVQVGLARADEWVGALHGVLALVVLLLAGLVHVRAMRAAKAASAA